MRAVCWVFLPLTVDLFRCCYASLHIVLMGHPSGSVNNMVVGQLNYLVYVSLCNMCMLKAHAEALTACSYQFLMFNSLSIVVLM